MPETNTLHEDMPVDFTLESLAKHFTQAEIDAMQLGDNPVFPPAGPSPEEVAAQEAAAKTLADAEVAKTNAVQVPDTTDAEALIAQIDTNLDALKSKFDDGDLTYAEWMAQQTALIKQQAQAQVQIERAAEVISKNAAQRRDDWFAVGDAYKAAGNEFLWSPEHIDNWHAALIAVNGNAEYRDVPFQRQYELAHDLYAANVKAITGKPIKAATTDAPAKEQAENEPIGKRPEPFQNLGGFNGDVGATLDDGSYAAADRLCAKDPIAGEQLISSWPASKQQEYLERV